MRREVHKSKHMSSFLFQVERTMHCLRKLCPAVPRNRLNSITRMLLFLTDVCDGSAVPAPGFAQAFTIEGVVK